MERKDGRQLFNLLIGAFSSVILPEIRGRMIAESKSAVFCKILL